MFAHKRVRRREAIGGGVSILEGTLLSPVRATLHRSQGAFKVVPSVNGLNPLRAFHAVNEQECIRVSALQGLADVDLGLPGVAHGDQHVRVTIGGFFQL